MNCWNCHNPVRDGARFCPNCGSSLIGPEQAQANAQANAQENAQAQAPYNPPAFGQNGPAYGAGAAYGMPNGGGTATAAQPKKPLSRKLLLILIAAAVVVIAVVVLLVVLLTGKPTVNLNKYLVFEEQGCEGYGYLSVTFDYESFEQKYYGKLKFDKKNPDVQSYIEYNRWWDDDYDEKADALALFEEYCISFSKEEDRYCSNGDTVSVYWQDPDESDLAWFRCKVKYSTVEHTMSKLEDPEEFDLFDGITVSFSGYDAVGTASVRVQSSSGLFDGLDFTLDPAAGLSNGDTVTVTASAYGMGLEEYCVRYYGMAPVTDTMTYTVSGLENAPKVDPFSYVTLKYAGYAPMGELSLSVDTSDPMIAELNFVLDRTTGLTVGDVVTITILGPPGYDAASYCLSTYGVALTSVSKEVTLSGINCYVTQLSQIPEEMQEQMQDQAMDALNDQITRSWGDGLTLKSADYLGSYLLVTKDWERTKFNECYLVYQITASGKTGDESFYFYTEFDNLTVLADGTGSVDLSRYVTPYVKVSVGNTYVYGYTTLDELYDACVTSNKSTYDCESSVSEE